MTQVPPRLASVLEGRYRIEAAIGHGGMAHVYRARDLKHQRTVALKVLREEFAASVGAARFLAEIRTTASLQHPHILPLFDSGEADGFLFYVMPYIEGESLADRLAREKQLPVDDAVQIARAVASALDYAHRHGVIHRDIKPANVLLHDGQAVIADFGIALAVEAAGGDRLTATGLSVGTPAYMSPEQIAADSRIGPATDVYALGCVLYEMLAGEPPYTAATVEALVARIVVGNHLPISTLRKSVPSNVAAVVDRSLQAVPADRFPSAQDFAAALGDSRFGETRNAPSLVAGWCAWLLSSSPRSPSSRRSAGRSGLRPHRRPAPSPCCRSRTRVATRRTGTSATGSASRSSPH
jgi:serine/threonine-protein kinase